jgi:hypothetical protein
MSASNVQPALSTTDWHLDLACHPPSGLAVADPGIDDPVNNTGLGPRRGDLQFSDEFASLISLICDESGEF